MSHILPKVIVYNFCHNSDFWFKLVFCLFDLWLLVSSKQNTNPKMSSVFDHILCFKTDADNRMKQPSYINHRQYHWFDMKFQIWYFRYFRYFLYFLYQYYDLNYDNSVFKIRASVFSILIVRYRVLGQLWWKLSCIT